MLVVAIFVTLRIDLGPSLRGLAERQATAYARRPIHIGGLSVRVARGRFELDDFSIDGLKPTDRPLFFAKQLSIALDWGKAFASHPEFIITSVEMTDWQMLVEKWPDGDNFLRLRRNNNQPAGPRRFTTTLQNLHAYRGPVHVRRPRGAVEHRRAEHRSRHHQQPGLQRHRQPPRRADLGPGLRADVGRLQRALLHRRPEAPLRPDRRRRATARRAARRAISTSTNFPR